MEPGGAQRLRGLGIRSVELRDFLPIFPVVNCFSICVFGEVFASC
jgi:hypothetical protein